MNKQIFRLTNRKNTTKKQKKSAPPPAATVINSISFFLHPKKEAVALLNNTQNAPTPNHGFKGAQGASGSCLSPA